MTQYADKNGTYSVTLHSTIAEVDALLLSMSIAQCIQRSLAVMLLLTMLLQRYRWVLVAGYSRVRTCREQHYLQHRGGYTIRCRSTDKLSSSVRNDLDIFSDIDDAMPVEFKSGFLTTMRDRGFIHQCTDFKTLDHKFSNGIVTAYLGNSKTYLRSIMAFHHYLPVCHYHLSSLCLL